MRDFIGCGLTFLKDDSSNLGNLELMQSNTRRARHVNQAGHLLKGI